MGAPATDPLVERLRAGEARAFEEAYRQWHPRVFSFLSRLTRQQAVAAELEQETWLRLAQEARWLTADTRLSAWLFTVAGNLARSHHRWSLIDGSRLLSVFGDGVHTPTHTPEHDAMAAQSQRALERALGSLNVKYREAVLLVGVEHFEPAEAAAIVGISAEAFRQRLFRAREALRAAMETP